ncbi:MAG: glutathione S-transferase [Rhodobacteraceae bacterium]|nr:glutathione S-transferase [Paracoccaceae bacterium]
MYKVVGSARSRAFRVMWMLEELGQPYEMIEGGPQSEEAKKYNPLGKIPALIDGTEAITDSVAIMTYLADKHSGMTAPAGTIERARQDAMTLWLIDEMDALLWSYAKHSKIFPEEHRITDIEHGLHFEFTRTQAQMETFLQSDYLMGDTFTLPDILATHCLGWAHGVGFPPAGEKTKDYIKRCRGRAAFRAAGAKGA